MHTNLATKDTSEQFIYRLKKTQNQLLVQRHVFIFSAVLGNMQAPLNAGTYNWPYLQRSSFAFAFSLSLIRAALLLLLLQSQVLSVLTTKEAGSTLHATRFRLRSCSIKNPRIIKVGKDL